MILDRFSVDGKVAIVTGAGLAGLLTRMVRAALADGDGDKLLKLSGPVGLHGKDGDCDGKTPRRKRGNGNEDDDGCPDQGKVLVVIGKQKLEIQDKIYFANGKDVILPRSEGLIAQVAKTIERNPWIKKLRIEGHTDNVGSKELNDRLGMERAETVKRYLYEQHQVPRPKINVISYGEDKPIAPNRTREGRAQNRRVVVKVLT